MQETEAVNRHVTRTVTLRPTNTFGIRMKARIAACGPARAALVVLD